MSWIWCNGEFRRDTLEVAATDRGLAHGLGAFETLLALEGRPVAWERHLVRLREGAGQLGIALRDSAGWQEAAIELLARCDLAAGRARLRLALTAGSGDLRRLETGGDARVWLTAGPCPPPPVSLTLATAPFPRNERSPLAGIKCASYAENLLALDHARRHGADEALFLNTRGEICEAATANLFIEIDGKLVTPPLDSGCLPGTARARVLEWAGGLGIACEERTLPAAALTGAVGLFLTSATRGVVPVTALDGVPVPLGPGGFAARLGEVFERRSAAEST